ncbi:MAG TPA: hypothetical protein PKG77_05625 [Phycisphaerae bacterium]|nr:hypothetical protein [Phycisphaerae bacterium]HQL72270.1 hypothetical protein [Phycisphaerae bacterium]
MRYPRIDVSLVAVSLAVLVVLSSLARAEAPPEVLEDWKLQDNLTSKTPDYRDAVLKIAASLGPAGAELAGQAQGLLKGDAPQGLALYVRACEQRRRARLSPTLDRWRRLVFTKHYDMGGSHYAYTEGQSDAQAERHFKPGTGLCILEMDGLYGTVKTLIDDPNGVIRDPDVSYDGKRILFSWKKSDREDDYHLYEWDVASGSVRQLTDGLGFADYEGCYLPDGNILFNSTRCVQTVDCWWTEVSNLFMIDGQGKHLRRISYDQVHTNFPSVTHDGKVIYTRWDYNDRGQLFPQGLFQMYADGTNQTEFYGNNSWFPTTVLHARAIPGTDKVLCIFTGHHSRQKGWLGILDPILGRQENQGAQLIAPVRKTDAVRIDAYGQQGDQWQYPYPLSEREYLVTFKPAGAKQQFALYWQDIDGNRELLVRDGKTSCNQQVPLAPRPLPPVKANMVDHTRDAGVFYVQDVYHGPGLAGVERGTVKSLRVIALDFRAAGVGSNGNRGPAGGALVSTPVSIQGTWDVKTVLGTAPVHPDGSAMFHVPAHTPVYFQLLDANNHAVQTMRSWAQLQPGETFSCAGCHEDKNSAPPAGRMTAAMKAGPQELTPWDDAPRGFSFHREIQPILDKHCIRCHHVAGKAPAGAADGSRRPRKGDAALRKYPQADLAKVRLLTALGADWSYTTTRPPAGWEKETFDDSKWTRAQAGFGTDVPEGKVRTAWREKEIWMRRTVELTAADLAKPPALVIHYDEDATVYVNGVKAADLGGFTIQYSILRLADEATKALRPGKNVIAVTAGNTAGGQYIDLALASTAGYKGKIARAEPGQPDRPEPAPAVAAAPPPEGVKPAFSLKGEPGTWSASYKALANPRICSWISVQSEPTMLAPYHAGAAKSKLIQQLREGHNGVKLSQAEMDRIACWIDLLVPCYGDYREGLSGDGLKKYEHFLEKRKRSEEQIRENIRQMLQARN